MTEWEYRITFHQLPEPKAGSQEPAIECNQEGLCFVHDAYQGGIEWLEDLFRAKGKEVGTIDISQNAGLAL